MHLQMSTTGEIQESIIEQAFSRQSVVFDEIYSGNAIIQYKRERVRSHVMSYAKPGNRMLELNSGTGEDAIFFAENKLLVHATDISAKKIASSPVPLFNSSMRLPGLA